MVTLARVILWGQTVGAVIWNERTNSAAFEYDKKFLKTGLDIAPIKMPIKEAAKGNTIFQFNNLPFETFRGLPGLLSDSLPDRYGNKLINEWLARQGRDIDSLNPVERLCFVGKRGMGALEFEPATKGFAPKKNESIEIEELVEIVNEILSEREKIKVDAKNSDGIKTLIKIGTSAGGARAKAIISFNKETKEIRTGQIENSEGFESWIIKFDGISGNNFGDPEGYGKIEYAYYEMAKIAGIKMMECNLLEENGRAHFMTKRFDRNMNEKIHMQTLCGIAHLDYNDPDSYSYEQAFGIMRNLRLDYSDMEQLFRRMVFNVLSMNCDDHTKNISFLMNKNGNWMLTPAYDLTYAYNPKSKWTSRHQLSVNGRRADITINDFTETAKSINIKRYSRIIAEVKEALIKWDDLAEKNKIKTEIKNEIGKVINNQLQTCGIK